MQAFAQGPELPVPPAQSWAGHQVEQVALRLSAFTCQFLLYNLLASFLDPLFLL